MINDLRFAVRLLRRSPGFTLAAILTLALGVGLNGAVFSLVRGVLLRPLPFDDPDRVVVAWTARAGVRPSSTYDPSDTPQSVGTFVDWRDGNQTFVGLSGVKLWKHNPDSNFDLVGADRTERLRGAFATPDFFRLLGVQAVLGRTFSDDDPPTVQQQVAVISDGLWQRAFGRDPGVVGRTVQVLGGRPRVAMPLTIIGVLPVAFRYTYPEDTEIWTPLPAAQIAKEGRGAVMYQVVGRLKPATTTSQAADDLARIEARAAGASPREAYRATRIIVVSPFRDKLTRASKPLLLTLGATSALVLLIACVNVASLLLGRAVARARELSLRSALGATRSRLLRQVLAESAVLGILGGVAGVAVLLAALPAFRSIVPAQFPRGDEVRVDASVLLVCGIATVIAIGLGALAPFFFGGLSRPLDRLRESSGGVIGGVRAAAWRRVVTALQVAIVFVLLAGTGLLLESFWRVSHQELGYDGRAVLTMEMRALQPRLYDEAVLAEFQRAVVERVRVLPGVVEAAMTSAVPLRGTDWLSRFEVAGDGSAGARTLNANKRQVSPEYFGLMRIPLQRGRLFQSGDNASAPHVAVVSESLARLIAPNGSAIGQRLRLDPDAEIVGIVGDVRTTSLIEKPPPAYYLPRAQAPSGLMCLVVRTAPGQAAAVASAARAVVRGLDVEQPVEKITTLDQIASESVADRRFNVTVTAAFCGVGLLLAAVGLGGVVSRAVVERSRELAIRSALGAEGPRLRRMIVSETLRPVVAGVACGVPVAMWLTTWIQSQLFDVHPRDPIVFSLAAMIMVAIAFAAAFIPARRATQADPMIALRAE
jgi:putative ABC transport system permease protein